MADTLPYTVADHLRDLAFSTIWNDPSNRDRANFKLVPKQSNSAISSVDLGFTRLMLPVAGVPYRVFSIGRSVYMGWVTPYQLTWMSAKDLGNNTGSELITYDYSGRVIDPAQVMLYYCPYDQMVYVAIPNYVMSKCVTSLTTDIYQTLFRDVYTDTPQVYTSLTVTNPTVDQITLNAIVAQIPTGQTAGLVVLQNGSVILSENIAKIKLTAGDQLVVMYDPDVQFTADISVDSSTTGYLSTKYGEYRELIHTPKALNPDNRLLRAEDLSMIVYDPVTGNARYLHRVADNFMMNVTHNDFSLSRPILNAFRDALGASSICVRVFYRSSPDPRYLTHDLNCIDCLYHQDDDDIIALMLGIKDMGVPEWKATNLEQAGFIDVMSGSPSSVDTDMLTTYTNALGWYQTAGMITQCKSSYTYTNADILIDKPPYLRAVDVDATVYADGKKVQEYFVSITQQNNQILLGFLPGANVVSGAHIEVRMSEKHTRTPVLITPSSDSPTYTADRTDFTIYRKIAQPSGVAGILGTYAASFEIVTPGTTTYTVQGSAGNYTITFDPDLYGDDLYLGWDVGRTCLHLPLDDLISEQKGLIVAPTYAVGSENVPVFVSGRIAVYLNGNRLVPNIDYTDEPVYTDTNGLVERPIVISNLTYLTQTGNILELVVDDFQIMFTDVGYNKSGVCERQTTPWVWMNSCSDVYTRGCLIPKVTDGQNYLMAPTTLQDGSPFVTEVLLDHTVAGFMSGLLPDTDRAIRMRSDATIPDTLPPMTSPIIVSQAYVLYSPYLTQITYDYLNGLISPVWDESDDLFLAQFSAYDPLKARDPVIGNANTNINRDLLDLSVNYGNWVINDMTKLKIIDRLCKLLFNNKLPTMGVTLA